MASLVANVAQVAPAAAAVPAPTLTVYKAPGEGMSAITMGPDGNIWYTRHPFVGGVFVNSYIGLVTPTGTITEFPTPYSNLYSITGGPDGNVWFTSNNHDTIGQITPGGVITEFGGMAPSGTSSPNNPYGITKGPDANLWFTEEFSGPAFQGRIGRITPTGSLTEFPLPSTDGNNFLENITTGPDGNLWFTAAIGNFIGRITPAGVITEFPVPTGHPGAVSSSAPFAITAGPDGNVWFTENHGQKIGRITPAGVITEYPVATCGLSGITTGPDGSLWFTDPCSRTMGEINVGGATTLFSPFPGLDALDQITLGPGGSLWATDNYVQPDGTHVGAIAVVGGAPSSPPALAVSISAPNSLSVATAVTAATGYAPNPFKVSATAQNGGGAATVGLTLSLTLPPGLSFAPGETADHSLSDIGPGATLATSWQVLAAPQPIATTLTYSVAGSANNAPTVTAAHSIQLPAVGFTPSWNGYGFVNSDISFAPPLIPSYEDMAGYYPESRNEMYEAGTSKPTKRGLDFYNHWFVPAFKSGYCYGMVASTTFLFNSASSSLQPISALDAQASSPIPPDATVQALIERFHARQYAAGGSSASAKSWVGTAITGNFYAFDQIEAHVAIRPQVVALGPRPTFDRSKFQRLFDASHAVVAYATIRQFGKEIIKIYDPNAPKDGGARIEIDSNGGIKIIHESPPEVTYGNGQGNNGSPGDWLLMPLDDTAFGSAGNTKWFLDISPVPLPTVFLDLSIPSSLSGTPVFTMSANQPNTTYAEQLPAGTGYVTTITANDTNSRVEEISGFRFATSTQTDVNAVGSTHDVAISADGTQLHLGKASMAEHFTLQLGADYLPNYSRQLTLTGASLVPGATVDLNTDATTNGFGVTSTGASQVVPATIEQLGQNAGSVTVQLSIPGGGGQASIAVFDWNNLAASLIYETVAVNGRKVVTVLQDNPAQRTAAIDGLFQQLTTSISTISDPDIRKALTAAVNVAQAFFHAGKRKTAANILIGLELVTNALSGTKISASTAASIVSVSQQIRGLL